MYFYFYSQAINIFNLTLATDDFLYKKRKNQSGILQRFVEPSGGGKHNSQIRAICTPKLCVLERRRTKQELHDSRFGLYERAVTFEGPEVHSISLPIRGETLPGKLRSLCHRVLNHMSDVTRSIKTSQQKDVRMVLHLKVDSKDRIWLLYSSSIRTFVSNITLDQSVEFAMEDHHMPQEGDNLSNTPLNIEDVIKLSPKIKLSQMANHDTAIDISNTKEYRYCPSCSLVQLEENFHPVPYKTVVTHFEQVMLKSTTQWPPPKEIIKSAGGVGFGKLARSEKVDSANEILLDEEDLLIPPVIRHFHKRLKAEGYRRYRSDPLFLHKHCSLCESCFLSYANLVSTSFQIKLPIKLDTELKHLRFDSKSTNEEVLKCCDRKQNTQLRTIQNGKQVESFCSNVALTVPTFPHAIIDPPTKVEEVNFDELMPLPYERIESPSQPLMHLIQMHERLEKSKVKRDKSSRSKIKLNPYEVPLKIVDRSVSRKKKNKAQVESRSESDHGSGSITTHDETIENSDFPLNRDEEVITLLSNTLTEMIARVSLSV